MAAVTATLAHQLCNMQQSQPVSTLPEPAAALNNTTLLLRMYAT
jgi:hypothetical protein